ncbi:hypothetical protein PM082_021910 [Marasmius tenuissimus]|nr:hypothetical protein PM082_021910 [Marasmius tenuissimus]
MFFKLSTPQPAVIAAMLFAGVTNTEQGYAVRNSMVTTRSCGPCTPGPTMNPAFKVALPVNPQNPVQCCNKINLSCK